MSTRTKLPSPAPVRAVRLPPWLICVGALSACSSGSATVPGVGPGDIDQSDACPSSTQENVWTSVPAAGAPPAFMVSDTRVGFWAGSSGMLVIDRMALKAAYHDPCDARWTPVPDLAVPADRLPTTSWNGGVQRLGNSILLWDPRDDPTSGGFILSLGKSLATPWKAMSSSGALGNISEQVGVSTTLLFFGGDTSETNFAIGHAFDGARNSWTKLPSSTLEPRRGHAEAVIGDALLVWGGSHPI